MDIKAKMFLKGSSLFAWKDHKRVRFKVNYTVIKTTIKHNTINSRVKHNCTKKFYPYRSSLKY